MRKDQRKKQATTAERRQQAFEMRKKGLPYAEIGKALGISMQAAHRHVTTYLQALENKTQEDAREIIRLDMERLDDMLQGLYPDAINGNSAAVDRVLRIMERRAKLLGLDKPAKVAATSPDGQDSWIPPANEDERAARIGAILERAGIRGHPINED